MLTAGAHLFATAAVAIVVLRKHLPPQQGGLVIDERLVRAQHITTQSQCTAATQRSWHSTSERWQSCTVAGTFLARRPTGPGSPTGFTLVLRMAGSSAAATLREKDAFIGFIHVSTSSDCASNVLQAFSWYSSIFCCHSASQSLDW
jgi:hypothetical protein